MSIPIIPILVALILVATLIWAANTLIPAEAAQARKVATVILVVLFVIWLVVAVFGVDLTGARSVRPLVR